MGVILGHQMHSESLPHHIVERLLGDFGANADFALQELERYRNEKTSVNQEWQDYCAYLLSLPAPEAPSAAAAASYSEPETGTGFKRRR